MHTLLSPVDAAWFRLDEAHNTADILALLTFAAPIDEDRLVERITERFRRFPRLVSRVQDPHGAGLPSWEAIGGFRVGDHIHRLRLDADGPEALQRAVNAVLARPLDRARPLWEIHLVEQPGAHGAVIARFHHCLGDGFALVGLLLDLADHAVPSPTPPSVDRPAPDAHDSWLTEAAAWIRHPEQIAEAALAGGRVAAALGRLLLLPFDSPSTLRRPLSGIRRVAWSDAIALDRFKVLSRATRSTVNDILVTALAGALRSWLRDSGDPVASLAVRAVVPVNLRPVEEIGQALGNRFGLVFLDLPIAQSHATERLHAIHNSMATLKSGEEAASSVIALTALGVVPEVIEHLASDLFTRKGSLLVTNVPGPRERLSIAGAPIDHVMFWAPHVSRIGLGVSLLSYADAVRIGVRADSAVLADPALLVRAFETELGDMEAELC